jgi:hypothetical protein
MKKTKEELKQEQIQANLEMLALSRPLKKKPTASEKDSKQGAR